MGNPTLVVRTRGERVESFHTGAFCLVNAKGEVVWSMGAIDTPIFSRSALKPFQSLPLIESGCAAQLNLSEEEIAVTCGSHNAEDPHVKAVDSILHKSGLDRQALQCGPQIPTGRIPRNQLRSTGSSPEHIHNNCSGKHAGFLALCQHYQWPIDNYLMETHPVQTLIRKTCAEMFELRPDELLVGEDGCSAPNYATGLYHLALGYKNLCHNTQHASRNQSCQVLLHACLNQPFMVAGNDRYCTEIMRAANKKVLGKTGADGVFCMAFPGLNMGCAIKIDDGKMGPQYFVAQAIIEALGIALNTPMSSYRSKPVINWNKHSVGIERISEELMSYLRQVGDPMP